jgi:hypothetical protein
MRVTSLLIAGLGAGLLCAGALSLAPTLAAEEAGNIPPWLKPHVGARDGQINELVLLRARELYLQKVREGKAKNPCYFAKDATRPAGTGRRFYVICEADQTFRAFSSGHGNGRSMSGKNFANGIRCAKNFSNAEGSKLTTGGAYWTAETRTSFKGYYRTGGKRVPLMRSFLQFEGEGDTANARERAIGGHPAVLLRKLCRLKDPKSPHADKDGYVVYGSFLNYSAGRSNGCTSWTPQASETIFEVLGDKPTTIYIYPESRDIEAVAAAAKARKSLASEGLYWDASCLREIGTPKFWPKETLEPIIDAWRKAHPPPPPRPLPICK